jgi:hypothetical protein
VVENNRLGQELNLKREDAMKPLEIQVEMTTEASKEFEEIQNHSHAALSGRAESYLMQLLRFPLKRWQVIQNQWQNSTFRSEGHLPFDIRGKVCYDRSGKARTVLITRFKLKEKIWRVPPGKKLIPRGTPWGWTQFN